jgi:hypothetical protein
VTRPIIQQFAGHYITNMGLSVVPLLPRDKKCVRDDWPNRAFTVDDHLGPTEEATIETALRLLLSGRPPKRETANILAGLSTCAVCGGGLIVETSARKRGRVPEYICSRHRANSSCSNALRIPVADMNEEVLIAIEEHVFTQEAIEQIIQLSERDDVRDQQAELERERKDIDKRISRLVAAIETAGHSAALVAKLHALETRQRAIEDESANLRPIPRLAPAVIEKRLDEWRQLLRASPTQARTVLQRVLRGRITFTPREDGYGYDFSAPTRFDKLFTGIASPRPRWIPVGKSGIENPHDIDYGRLLDRVYVKGLASPTGFEPVFWP